MGVLCMQWQIVLREIDLSDYCKIARWAFTAPTCDLASDRDTSLHSVGEDK